MAAVAIAGPDVVVTRAKAIKNAVDIPTTAPAILAPFRIESLPEKALISIAFQPPHE
jgi:hypothetical protein